MSLMAVLICVCVGTGVVSAIMAVCGVLACRRKRAPPPSAPAHWSTHVTVTPECRGANSRETSAQPQNTAQQQQRVPTTASNGDRVALIAFADQDPVVLPSYEDALREDRLEGRGQRMASSYRPHHGPHGRPRARHQAGGEHMAPHKVTGGYGREPVSRVGGHRRRHDPDAVSHSSLGWPSARPTSGSNSASLGSGSVQSVETVGNSEGTNTSGATETSGASQTPSCR